MTFVTYMQSDQKVTVQYKNNKIFIFVQHFMGVDLRFDSFIKENCPDNLLRPRGTPYSNFKTVQ